jgi:hypothetical protein
LKVESQKLSTLGLQLLVPKVEDLDVWAFSPQVSMAKVGNRTFSAFGFQFPMSKVGDLKSCVISLQLLVLKVETWDFSVDENFPNIFLP